MINVFEKEKKKEKKEKKGKRNRDDVDDADDDERKVQAEEVVKKKDKKSKKSKKESKEEVEDVSGGKEEAEEVEDEERRRKEKKKAKKEAKRIRKHAMGVGNDGDEDENSREARIITSLNQVARSRASSLGNDYVVHAEAKAMSIKEIQEYRNEANMVLVPEEQGQVYFPLSKFEYIYPSLDPFSELKVVRKYLIEKNFPKPSPIQAQCWPPLFAGKDTIGIASTGSGKTLAFLIPGLQKICKANKLDHANGGASRTQLKAPCPKLLVLAPTRELAMQSHAVATELGGFKSVCIFGGMSKYEQKKGLRDGAEIVIATPGRLIDLLEENALSLSEIRYLVLDEADRMLDDGFEPAIRRILSSCPSSESRQTVMFSATWPESIRALAETFLASDVVRVIVGGDELSANHRVKQIVECVDAHQKDGKIIKLLSEYHKSRKNRILVFVLYKNEATRVQNHLASKGYNVTSIHGDKSQVDRIAALNEFKSGNIPLLIATDVAARGLDIPQVEYVINYSFPLTVEDYIHRIGRTGRGGATGISHTFFTDFDKQLAGGLVNVLQEAKQEVPKEIYKYPMITKKVIDKTYGAFGPKKDLIGKKSTKITFDD